MVLRLKFDSHLICLLNSLFHRLYLQHNCWTTFEIQQKIRTFKFLSNAWMPLNRSIGVESIFSVIFFSLTDVRQRYLDGIWRVKLRIINSKNSVNYTLMLLNNVGWFQITLSRSRICSRPSRTRYNALWRPHVIALNCGRYLWVVIVTFLSYCSVHRRFALIVYSRAVAPAEFWTGMNRSRSGFDGHSFQRFAGVILTSRIRPIGVRFDSNSSQLLNLIGWRWRYDIYLITLSKLFLHR